MVTIKLLFKDSYLLMDASLANLAKTFGVKAKGSFDISVLVEGYNRSLYRDDLIRYNPTSATIDLV